MIKFGATYSKHGVQFFFSDIVYMPLLLGGPITLRVGVENGNLHFCNLGHQ